MNYFLTIAASDSSGGAGLQQDIKVAHDFGYWALSAVTGITSQNFNKVSVVEPVKPELLKNQIDQCLSAFSVKTVKIGALCSLENIIVIAESLKKYKCKIVVLDPVLFSTGGQEFLPHSALNILKDNLFPLSTLITPNKNEFELLTESRIENIEDAVKIAKELCKKWNTSIYIKGGHFNYHNIKEALVTNTNIYWFERDRKMFSYSHGTGCTISTALACLLGDNIDLVSAYQLANEYLVKYYSSIQERFKS